MNLWITQVADEKVTVEEWVDFHKDLSAAYDQDDDFIAAMRGQWNL